MIQFLPFRDIRQHPEQVVVVDASHPDAPALSHWRGANIYPEWADDTSTGIVLNAIKGRSPLTHRSFASNNHFDIDGFLGIWSLMHPDLAMRHEAALREAALIGDFREYNPAHPGADLGLKLASWINEEEQQRFYRPFAEREEVEACVAKYAYFLPLVEGFLMNPDRFASSWKAEYEQVQADRERLQAPDSHRLLDTRLRMAIQITPEPLHYYALFGGTANSDLVVSLYQGQRYELEYKYTSWVDTATRIMFPRLDLSSLVDLLNAQEKGEYRWTCDSIMDTGPILRLGGAELSKAERFAHPNQRPIFPSSWSPEDWLKQVRLFFQEAYRQLKPQGRWTWAEMKAAQLTNNAMTTQEDIPAIGP